jgi:hypothetical protein
MRSWVWVVMMICFAGWVAGCSVSSDDGDPPEAKWDRTTPERLIKYLADAYVKKDIDKYLESLSDSYLFEFDPQDYDDAGVSEDEPWWGKTEDRTSTGNMFDDAQVTKIEMDLPIAGGPWPGEDDAILYRLDPYIKVFTDDPAAESGETIYHVYQSWLDVEIVEDPFDSTLWVFNEIVESTKSPTFAPLEMVNSTECAAQAE